jgi:DNA primase
MSFSREFIEKVRDANNIIDIISEFTTLKRTGSGYMGCCPLPGHNEKSPSFSVSETKQVYHCFGCQRKGNIYTAVQELKNLSFPEAIEYLADRASISIPKDDARSTMTIEAKSTRETMLKINKAAATYYHQNLLELSSDHPVRKYCQSRGLNEEIIKKFHLGYATDEWEGLRQHLSAIKAPLPLAEKLGLLRPRKTGDGSYDLFRNRLMFPIQNHKEEFVGFGGRVLSDEDQPKYLNSVESDVFSKGQTFYGLHESSKHIRGEEGVLVVEGYMDFLALYKAGIRNVVATLGTALTTSHAKLLKRSTHNVVILFDGDAAGQRAAERSLPTLLAEGLFAKGLTLPDELDPDEFVAEKGVKALQSLISRAPELFQLELDRFMVSYRGTAADKITILDKVKPLFESIADSRLYDLYVAELAQRLSVEPGWVAKNLPRSSQSAQNSQNGTSVTPNRATSVIQEGSKIKLLGAPKSELFLLNIALMKEGYFEQIWQTEIVDRMSHPGVQELFIAANEFYRQNSNEFAKLTSYLMTRTATPNEVGLHLGEPFVSMTDEAVEKMIADCRHQIEMKNTRVVTREIAAKMRLEPASEQIKKLEQIVNIRKSSRNQKNGN